MYIINDFCAKIFINNDNFNFELIIVYLNCRKLITNNCEFIALMLIKTKNY